MDLLLSEPGLGFSVKSCFGGGGLESNPKRARPFSSHSPMHIVFRCRHLARVGALKRYERALLRIIGVQAKIQRAQLLKVLVRSDHVHVVIQFSRREKLSNFLRACGGLFSRRLMGVERGQPSGLKKGLWQGRPFSRIVNSNFLDELKKTAKKQNHSISFLRSLSMAKPKQMARLEHWILAREWG